jgi:negative regulator of flagellin synthesis FlgM
VSNEINSVDGGGPAAVGTGRVAQRPQTADAPASGSGPAESIHITDAASQLAGLEQAVRGLPAVDETRVAAVSTSIEQGTYNIAPQTIADQLIQLERSLGALGSG